MILLRIKKKWVTEKAYVNPLKIQCQEVVLYDNARNNYDDARLKFPYDLAVTTAVVSLI